MSDVIVKDSKIEGKGVFANKDFKKDESVLKWHPSEVREKDVNENLKKYIMKIGDKFFLMNPPEKYINHSCEPNTIPNKKRLCDVAIKDIKKERK